MEADNIYRSTNDVKTKIRGIEEAGGKSITLTVNRMLTGSTVREWDTMVYLKDSASPQEYDQSIFRIQNPYIKEYVDKEGNVIKYDMKPQTLLVDFKPDRMFHMQEQKALEVCQKSVWAPRNASVMNKSFKILILAGHIRRWKRGIEPVK